MKSRIAFMTSLAGAALMATPVAAQLVDAAPAGDLDTPIIDVPPAPIAGIAASYATPPHDNNGAYATPNRDLTADEVTWHVRVALNVAALGCRDAGEQETIARYNQLLANAQDALAAAQAGMTAHYKAAFGAAWQARNDDHMTKLYNFFAQTVAHDEFCAVAQGVLREAVALEPSNLNAFAVDALPRLEAPFLAFFARYDAYRVKLAAWQGRHARDLPSGQIPVQIIAAAAAPAIIPPQR